MDKVVEERRQEEEKKKADRMTGIQGQGTQSRGDVEVDMPFFELYNKETQLQRKLPNLEVIHREDFVLKEELPFAISSLKEFLKNDKIIIEEINEDEIIDEEDLAFMKASEVKDQNSDKVLFKLNGLDRCCL